MEPDPALPSTPGQSPTPAEQTQPLVYEEAPIIEPLPATQPAPQAPPPSVRKGAGRNALAFLGVFLVFFALFALGVWLSVIMRSVLSGGLNFPSIFRAKVEKEEAVSSPSAAVNSSAASTPAARFDSDWIVYSITGANRQPVEGASLKLPPNVSSPTCDGMSCASQGTYLPGGTRLTIAARGLGFALGYTPGAVITDATGQRFETKQASISGRPALEYSGVFRGKTAGGYAFTQMRGAMVEARGDLTVELNHFTPAGVTVDFAADDSLFDKILQTLTLPALSSPSAAPSPTVAASP